MPVLMVEKGPDRGRIAKYTGKEIVVGRGSKVTFKLEDTLVSREHFKIFFRDEVYYVEDLGSLNGTQYNDDILKGIAELTYGSQIIIGESTFSWLEQETDKQDPLVNKKLGGYHIVKRLGRGGMGTVYLARQLSLQRNVAIKVLDTRLGHNKEFIKRFVEEARASATLNHPNILQVYDVGENNGLYYFSMEYAANDSIQRLIEGQKKLTLSKALDYMLDTAQGLEYAERKKIVHRDIKPDNLMLNEDHIVKIGDLGLAKRLDRREKKEEGIFGTPHFIAPEQAKGEAVDHRTDMYSFGASFYRILSGRTPFQGESVQQIVMKHVMKEPEPLTKTVPGIPSEVSRLISKMMHKNPNKRYQSHNQVIEQIMRLQQLVKNPGEKVIPEIEIKTDRRVRARQAGVTHKRALATTGRHGQKRSRQNKNSTNQIIYSLISAFIFVLVIVFAFKPATPSKSKKTKSTRQTSKKNNRTKKKPVKNPWVVKYQKLKSLQFSTATNPEKFIKEYQLIAQKAPKNIAQKAENDVRQLLEENLWSPCKKYRQEKRYKQAFELLDQYQELLIMADLQKELSHKKNELAENFVDNYLYDKELGFYQYLQRKKYKKIEIDLVMIKEVAALLPQHYKDKTDEIVDKWKAELAKYEIVEPKEVKTEDEQTKKEYLRIVNDTIEFQDFARGTAKLKSLFIEMEIAKVQIPENWKRTRQDITLLNMLIKRINDNIKNARYPLLREQLKRWYVEKKSVKNPKNIAQVRIKNIKNGEVTLVVIMRTGGNLVEQTNLKELSPLWIYDNLIRMGKFDKQGWKSAALYCFYYKLFRQSWQCCRKAGNGPLIAELEAELRKVEQEARDYYKDIIVDYRQLRKWAAKINDFDEAEKEELKGATKKLQQSLKNFERNYQHTRYMQKRK